MRVLLLSSLWPPAVLGGAELHAAALADRLVEAGYEYIGMDHFAKPTDELAVAQRERKLHRNFQGYSTKPDCDLLAFGISAIGKVGNADHMNVILGKAGRKRWMGRMPHNRGVTMNPIDHPHGGGEGRTGEGRAPVDPWGNLTKGYRTRNNKRTQVMIVSRRKK